MKTVALSEVNYFVICEALSSSITGLQMSIEFLSSRFGYDAAQVQEEVARLEALVLAEAEFRAAGQVAGYGGALAPM